MLTTQIVGVETMEDGIRLVISMERALTMLHHTTTTLTTHHTHTTQVMMTTEVALTVVPTSHTHTEDRQREVVHITPDTRMEEAHHTPYIPTTARR